MGKGGPEEGQPDTPPTTLQRDPAEAERHARKEEEKRATKTSFAISAKPDDGTAKRGELDLGATDAPRQYRAAAFNTPDVENSLIKSGQPFEQEREFERYVRQTEINWVGLLVFIAYLCSLVFYLWVRITKTLDLGAFVWYGYLVLGVELMGASTVILYGTNLLRNPVIERPEEDSESPGKPKVKYPYHVRVLVPCYKESLEILRRTIMAAYDATLPEGCQRTIYLCDDGKDPKKRKWVDSLGPDVVYVSGRKRESGEMNGKSGNLNNVCSQMYPKDMKVPGTELVCIFDADQVASKEFFLKTLPLFDGGDDVGMVLSPQCFHNLNLHSDIFNHSNVHFWEYMQPGYDAIGFISCTGTNFLIRANAFIEVGGSPTYTLTEDYALGMELKKYGWHCRYVQEYLAIGEAPDQIRNCYQQRSRWCKGHFQIMFNKEHCPLVQKRLSFGMRILYASGVWSYIVGAISTPAFIIIPMVTIWAGVFPIVVSWWAALGVTVSFVATNSVLYYVRSLKHIEALWFANVANSLLWWTYVKAFTRAVNSVCGQKIQFKTTLKGASMLMNSAFRDLWMPGLCFLGLFVSFMFGLVHLFTGPTISSPLAISVIWCIYNMIPPFLVLYYAGVSKGVTLQWICRFCIVLSFFAGATAVGLMWGLYPKNYDYGTVLGYSNKFYNAMRVGVLPADNGVAWRSNAFLQDVGPNGVDATGGWMNGGAAGNVKLTITHAFTTSMLAWGLLSFPGGYKSANQTQQTMAQVRWGSDYLLKAVGPGVNGTDIVYQIGNLTADAQYWGRPEDYTDPRPYYTSVLNPKGGSDLAGGTIAALAASALVWRQQDYGYYQKCLATAADLYTYAVEYRGLYAEQIRIKPCATPYGKTVLPVGITKKCTPEITQLNGTSARLYNGTTYYDKLLWAAAWMYKATGDNGYLDDAEKFYVYYLYEETGSEMLISNWDNYYWASNVLLAQLTNGGTFHERSEHFMSMWVCGFQEIVQYTPRGRAWNRNAGTLGDTANAALLATIYASHIRYTSKDKAAKYDCWARGQMRYVLGDSGSSLVVGYGEKPPTHVASEPASCPPAPLQCNQVNALLNPLGNPNIIYGALVEGGVFTDTFQDVRTLNDTRVSIEYNAGFQGVLAGLTQAPGTWEQCLQGYGVLTVDKTVCGTQSS